MKDASKPLFAAAAATIAAPPAEVPSLNSTNRGGGDGDGDGDGGRRASSR